MWPTLAYVLARERLAPRLVVGLAAALPVLVGASRMYVGLHWPSDVVGGWALGVVAAARAALYERLREGD